MQVGYFLIGMLTTFGGVLPRAQHATKCLMRTSSFNSQKSHELRVDILHAKEMRFAKAKYLSDVLLSTMLEPPTADFCVQWCQS